MLAYAYTLLSRAGHPYAARRNNNVPLDSRRSSSKLQKKEGKFDGCTPLMQSAMDGCLVDVLSILEDGGDVNAQNEFGWSALMFAALRGHAIVVKTLIRAGAGIDIANRHGDTALTTAAEHGHGSIVLLLLESGAIDSNNRSLFLAAAGGHNDIITTLLSFGGDVNCCAPDGSRPLLIAANNGHTSTLRCLLHAGAMPDSTGYNSETALHVAAARGFVSMVRALLEHGCQVNPVDSEGNTPLHLAVRAHMSGVDAKANWKARPDMSGALCYQAADLITLLCAAGADVHARNHAGVTVFQMALRKGNTTVLAALSAHAVESRRWKGNEICSRPHSSSIKRCRRDGIVSDFVVYRVVKAAAVGGEAAPSNSEMEEKAAYTHTTKRQSTKLYSSNSTPHIERARVAVVSAKSRVGRVMPKPDLQRDAPTGCRMVESRIIARSRKSFESYP